MSPHTESTKEARRLFEMEMANLSLNYRQKLDMKTVDWYWRHLQKYPKENLLKAIKLIVEKEEYFPSIAIFKKYLDPELEFPKPEPFPTREEIKARTPVARLSLDLIFKFLDRKISFEQYLDGIEGLEEKFMGIGFKQAADALRREEKRRNALPALDWRSEWPLGKPTEKKFKEEQERIRYPD